MPKPSLLQTILRQPSQSYASGHDPERNSRRGGSSIRSGGSSRLSVTSNDSYATGYSVGSSEGRTTAEAWEWSTFGGRKGLTGGPASLRAPSEIARAGRGASLKQDGDARSLRSTRSLGSVKSSSSALGNGASWTQGTPGLLDGQVRSRTKGNKPSRRYGDIPASPSIQDSAFTKHRPTSLQQTSTTSNVETATQPRIIHQTSSSPDLKTKRRHSRDQSAPSLSTTSQPPSLTSSPASSTLSSASPLTPVESSFYSPLPPPVTRRKNQRRDSEREKELASVDEGNEDAPGSRRQSFGPMEAIELPNKFGQRQSTVTSTKAFLPPHLEIISSSHPVHPTFHKPELTTDATSSTSEPAHRPPETVEGEHLAAISTEDSAPRSTVQPISTTSSPLPSFHTNITPIIGRTFTMDELFASLPLPILASPASSPSSLSVSHPATLHPIPNDRNAPHIPTPTLVSNQSSSLLITPPRELATDSPKLLPAAVLRLSQSYSTGTSASSDQSSWKSENEQSSPATDFTKSDNSLALLDEDQTSVPRIRLTRTSSDQKASGVPGYVDLDPALDDHQRHSLPPIRPKSPQRRSVSPTPSKPPPETSQQRLTSAHPASPSSATSLVANAPYWLRNVRGLDESTAHLSEAAKTPASTRRSNSLMVRPKEPFMSNGEQGLRRGSPEGSILETCRPGRSRETTPTSSILGDLAQGDTTIPRRRAQSAIYASEGPIRPYDLTSSTSIPDFKPFVLPAIGTSIPTSPPNPPPIDLPSSPPRKRASSLFGGKSPTSPPTSPTRKRASSIFGGKSSHTAPPPQENITSVFSNASSAGAPSSSDTSPMSVPVGAFRPAKNPKRVALGSEKLARNKSTMRALFISSNAAAAIQRPGLFKRNAEVDLKRQLVPESDFQFGPFLPPPKSLRGSEVLVEILAVGLDLVDYERAREMASLPAGAGWVPGRSFCGKAVECGYEVSKIRKGDFVYGCQDLKKSGALAELMIIDRNLLSHAPSCGLSVEDIAALPAAGILAVQVMESLCHELPKGSKILILNAHDGVGNLCMQLVRHFRPAQDLWIVAHCHPNITDGEGYCRATGASDVIRDEPLATLNRLHESSFDAVIDTIGSRRLYDASRRILHFEGQFITTVGDSLSAPTPGSQFKSNIRSLRRAFFPKDKRYILKKQIGYWAINFDERELPREALDKLRDAVEIGGVRPAVRRVVAFAQAASAFDLEMGAGRVVKVVQT
ncbi:hypothetical protein P7C70_g59, partial [Phenoliferia sp. Uapishka_3]